MASGAAASGTSAASRATPSSRAPRSAASSRARRGGDRRAAGKENEAAPAPAAAAAPPPAPPFDLEAELEAVVGLAGAKDALRSLRNRLVVGKKRAALGVVDAPPRLYLLVGAPGAAFGAVARALAGLLGDLGVVGASKVAREEATRWRCGGRGDRDRAAAAARAAADALDAAGGGVLLVGGAGDLCDGDGQAAALDALCEGWRSERTVLAVAVDEPRRAALLRAAPRLAAARAVALELADYSEAELAELVRRDARARGFAVDPAGDGPDWLVRSLAPRRAGAGEGEGGVILARACVDGARRRQTDRVYASGTASSESLLRLRRADFEDDGARADAGAAALAALDGVVGLAGVKEHVRALTAQVRLDRERRRHGMPGGAGREPAPASSGAARHGQDDGRAAAGAGARRARRRAGGRPGRRVRPGALVAPYMGQTALKVRGGLRPRERRRAVRGRGPRARGERQGRVRARGPRHAREAPRGPAGRRRRRPRGVLRGDGRPVPAEPRPGVALPARLRLRAYTAAELGAIARGLLAARTSSSRPAPARRSTSALAAAGGGNGRAARNIVEAAARRMARRLDGRLRDRRTVPPTSRAASSPPTPPLGGPDRANPGDDVECVVAITTATACAAASAASMSAWNSASRGARGGRMPVARPRAPAWKSTGVSGAPSSGEDPTWPRHRADIRTNAPYT